MCNFNGRLSMKQYIKKKPIKWGFKYWYRWDTETGYTYQLLREKGKKGIEFRFEYRTKLIRNPERYLLSSVFS